VFDAVDAELTEMIAVRTLITDTIMKEAGDRLRLGEEVLAFSKEL
jgi:hypothetical protein